MISCVIGQVKLDGIGVFSAISNLFLKVRRLFSSNLEMEEAQASFLIFSTADI